MEIQFLAGLMEQSPNIAISLILLYFIYKIHGNLLDMKRDIQSVDKEIEYLKIKVGILQDSLDRIKEDSIRTAIEASHLKERLDLATREIHGVN